MDVYFKVVTPKLNNLLVFLTTRFQEEMIQKEGAVDEEVLNAIISGYKTVYSDPVALGTAVISLLEFWEGEKGINKEALKVEVEKRKQTAHEVYSKLPGFDEVKWQKCVNYDLPEDVEEKLYMYYHMLCDLAVSFGIDQL
jgi:hypothetical protein